MGSSSYDEKRKELLELETQKKKIEDEATMLLEVLNSPGANGDPPVGLTGNLVDKEGFPRADIDVHAVRTQRHRLACLRTDRKELEKKIEQLLHDLHSMIDMDEAREHEKNQEKKKNPVPPPQAPSAIDTTSKNGDDYVALTSVNQVMEGSPAAEAGLKVGDRILKFGSVFHLVSSTGEKPKLPAIAAETGANINKEIEVIVLRDAEKIQLKLTPKSWSGPGALGCHILPL